MPTTYGHKWHWTLSWLALAIAVPLATSLYVWRTADPAELRTDERDIQWICVVVPNGDKQEWLSPAPELLRAQALIRPSADALGPGFRTSPALYNESE